MACRICADEEKPTRQYYDLGQWCDGSIKMDQETDWDAWEENKRQRVAEESEY